jgi:hypothetical protein
MKKIIEITPEQAERFGKWTKRWIDIGLSTEPADFKIATAAALKAYKLCNLSQPQIILHMDSPYGATVGGTMAWSLLRNRVKSQAKSQAKSQVKSQVNSQIESQIWSQVGSQVDSQVDSQVQSQVESQVCSQVQSQVYSQVDSQVWSQVYSQVYSQVQSQVGSQVWPRVWSAIYNDRGGAFWSGWCAYVSFLRDVMGWENSTLDNFTIDEDLAKSCGWVWWHENVLAISNRPKEIHRDNTGALHSTIGPSISYRDGWSLYHVHGVSIPKDWIENKDKLEPSLALTWDNVEQRRALAELVGWDKVLSAVKCKSIHKDEYGELLVVDLPQAPSSKFVRVVCGTGRTFVLPVPQEMKSAHEAVAWTYGLDRKEYQPKVRT